MKYSIEKNKEFPYIDKPATGRRIKALMDDMGLTVKDVKEYLQLGSVQSVYHWLNGKTIPSLDNILALSILFGVTIDDIICSEQKPPQIYYDYVPELHSRWSSTKAAKCIV